MKSAFQILAVFCLVALVSCQSPLATLNETSTATGPVGALHLAVNEVKATASVAGARTIYPTGATIASYKLTGTGPAGAPLSVAASNSGNFNVPGLAVGEWNLTVSGTDSTGVEIATGTQKVMIEKDKSASATIVLAPVAGKGTVEVTVSWPVGQVVDQVAGALTNDAGVSTPVTLVVSGSQATASVSVSNVDTGYYMLILQIRNEGSNVTSPRFDGVLVYNNKTTKGNYPLVAADFDYAAVTGVTMDKATVSVGMGATLALNATVVPDTATLPVMNWSSSNEAIVTVDFSGKVSGVALGEATITATSIDGAKTATCVVTVKPKVTGLNKASTGLLVEGTEQLVVLTNPANAANPGVVWSSADAGVATVDQTGKVTAMGAGTTSVKATAADGDTYATCVVTVSTTAIPVTAVTVTPTIFSLLKGQVAQLTNGTTPTDATNQNVTWSSSNTSVATVDASGLVTAVTPGTSVITVTSLDGVKTATSTVYVSTSNWLVVDKSLWSDQYSQSSSTFRQVGTDSAGNVYTLGTANYAFDFGSGIAKDGNNGYFYNANLLIKFDSSGNPLWAKMINNSDATVATMAVDGAGNSYLLGTWNSAYASVDYTGGAVWGTGTQFLLKFDSAGKVQWAQPVIRGSGVTLSALAVDNAGNLYLAGSINGSLAYQFVGGFSVVGTSTGTNALVVKCDAAGSVQWAKSTTQGTSASQYSSVAVDGTGNVYTSGWFGSGSQPTSDTYGFGNSVSATGVGFAAVKYTGSGSVAWASLTTSAGYLYQGSQTSTRLAVDTTGTVYAAHSATYSEMADLRYGALSAGATGYNSNSFLVKYDTDGTPTWVKAWSATNSNSNTILQGVALNSSGQVVAVGNTTSLGTKDFGNGVTLGYSPNSLFSVVFGGDGTAVKAEVLCGDPVKQYRATSLAVSGSNLYIAGERSTINNTISNTNKALLLQY